MKIFDVGIRITAALLVIGSFAPASQATEITLIADRDNTLIESATGDRSNGIGMAIFAGRTAEGTDSRRRAVIGFDIAAEIPAGSVIESVTLTLTRTGGNSSPSTLTLHSLLSDWGEGTSSFDGGMGAPSTPGDATWIHGFFDTDFWTPGGDFDPTASATIFQKNGNVITWSSSAMAADVQSWLDNPDDAFGWILLGDESVGASAIKLASRDNDSLGFRPALTVVYTPEPNTIWLLAAGICALAAAPRRAGSAD